LNKINVQEEKATFLYEAFGITKKRNEELKKMFTDTLMGTLLQIEKPKKTAVVLGELWEKCKTVEEGIYIIYRYGAFEAGHMSKNLPPCKSKEKDEDNKA
jgi:hypothetical protein